MYVILFLLILGKKQEKQEFWKIWNHRSINKFELHTKHKTYLENSIYEQNKWSLFTFKFFWQIFLNPNNQYGILYKVSFKNLRHPLNWELLELSEVKKKGLENIKFVEKFTLPTSLWRVNVALLYSRSHFTYI